jgi:rRNA maturation protein Rpf1
MKTKDLDKLISFTKKAVKKGHMIELTENMSQEQRHLALNALQEKLGIKHFSEMLKTMGVMAQELESEMKEAYVDK